MVGPGAGRRRHQMIESWPRALGKSRGGHTTTTQNSRPGPRAERRLSTHPIRHDAPVAIGPTCNEIRPRRGRFHDLVTGSLSSLSGCRGHHCLVLGRGQSSERDSATSAVIGPLTLLIVVLRALTVGTLSARHEPVADDVGESDRCVTRPRPSPKRDPVATMIEAIAPLPAAAASDGFRRLGPEPERMR